MTSSFRVGKVFGISIRIDWSWFFIFLLITWNLSVAFGQYHAGWSVWLRWGVGIAAALLFFVSVLAHEMAHSLVARARGVPVRSITLFMFGGVSNIQREPPSPASEFLLTIVGPLTSILLGVGFTLVGSVVAGPNISVAMGSPEQTLSGLSPLATLLLWLGPINIFVGVFNLIPGFPLDGGRLVRSALWAATGSVRQATRWASWLGQFIAWAMIAAGIAMVFGADIPLLGTGLIPGLWLAFIGWFLNSASIQSYRQLVVHDLLEDIPIRRLMRSDPPTVPSSATVSSLVHDHVMGSDDHAFPVIDDGRLVGLVTLEDIRSTPREAWDTTTVQEIMTPVQDLSTTTPEEESASALDLLRQRDVRQLPVLQQGQFVGILRRKDIIKWLQLQADVG